MKSRARQQPAAKPSPGRTAVTYVRVSSKEQEQGFSIPAQRQLLTEYAEREGLHVVQEFEDVETAKRAGRTAFGEMVAFLRQRGSSCRTLLVEKTDRLYRNIKDWVTIDELGIEVHFVKENVVLSEDSRSSEKFMHGIKVLMAKNYIDNLGEEVRKGMIEKARQGHWPTVAPVGYQNNRSTHRIEPDPERAPIVVKLFEWYASGEYSLKALTKKAAAVGLTNRTGGSPLVKAKIHQLLHNPIYYGEFYWLGQLHQGLHTPIISRGLFDRVQQVFASANRPRHTKRRHAFAGLVTCGRCGCAYTAETKKGQYVYYHCTGHRGPCGNTYVREEELVSQFGRILQQVRIPAELAGSSRRSCGRARRTRRSSRGRRCSGSSNSSCCSARSWTESTRTVSERPSPRSCGVRNRRNSRRSYAACAPRWSATRPPARPTRPRGCRFSNSRKPRIRRTLRRIRTNRRAWSERSYRTPRSIAELSHLLTLSRSTCSRGGAKAEIGSSGWTRTSNPPVNSRMLCH